MNNNVTSLPFFIRKFIVDFVSTCLGALFLLNIAFPTSIDEARKVFVIVGVAVASSLVASLRRTAPEFLKWLRNVLNVQS